jgi:hypothetical protein
MADVANSGGGGGDQVHLDPEALPTSVAGTVARATSIAGQGAAGGVADTVTSLMAAGVDPLSAAVAALVGTWPAESTTYFTALGEGGEHLGAAAGGTVGGLSGADGANAAAVAAVTDVQSV